MVPRHSDRLVAGAVLLFLLCVYLLTYSGSLHSSDGQAMFSVAESLVRTGSYDINQIRWMGLQQGTFGPDGNLYSRKGLGTSLTVVPLAWLGLSVPWWGVVQTAMLLDPIVTALTGMLLFLYVRRLGHPQRIAVVTSLAFGLATISWPYSKYLFSEPLTGFCLFAAAYFMLPVSDEGRSLTYLSPLIAGFFLGLSIATRLANAVLVPIYLAVLIVSVLRQRGSLDPSRWRNHPDVAIRDTWREVLLFALPLLGWVAIIGLYNWGRFGNPLITGYLPEESFSAPWLLGIAGLLVSPGKGIIFFCPVIVAALVALPRFCRRHRLQAVLVGLVSLSYLLLYGKWFMWHGGFAWGPRFLLPIIPLLCLPLASLLEGLSGVTRALFWALFAVSAGIQLLGCSVHFVHHQELLLQSGLPLFDPVTFFDPRYSQLWGTLPLLRVDNLDFAWIRSVPSTTVDWPALLLNMLLVVLSGCTLAVVASWPRLSPGRCLTVLVVLVVLVIGGTTFSLSRYAHDGHEDYVEMLRHLEANSTPTDAIVQNAPQETAVLQNHYKGHLPSYGLFEGQQPLSGDSVAVLQRLSDEHPRVWLIPDDLPPRESSLDEWFIERGWSPSHSSFGDQRLTLYSRP